MSSHWNVSSKNLNADGRKSFLSEGLMINRSAVSGGGKVGGCQRWSLKKLRIRKENKVGSDQRKLIETNKTNRCTNNKYIAKTFN